VYAFAPFPSLNLRCAGEAFVRNALDGLLPIPRLLVGSPRGRVDFLSLLSSKSVVFHASFSFIP